MGERKYGGPGSRTPDTVPRSLLLRAEARLVEARTTIATLTKERDRLRAERDAIAAAMDAAPDSDLVSLARYASKAVHNEGERMRAVVEAARVIYQNSPGVRVFMETRQKAHPTRVEQHFGELVDLGLALDAVTGEEASDGEV